MISWIQITFQRHFRIVFLVLLAVLIVAFVFTIGAAPGIGQADRSAQARTFFDLNLSSPEGQATLYQDASLSIMLQAGTMQVPQAQMQEFALQRYASLYLAKQLNLPGPTDAELEEFIQGVRTFSGPDGNFDPEAYATFRENLKEGGRFTEADIVRVLKGDFLARRVNNLLSGPGYVDESEVAFQLKQTDTVWTVNVARVDYASFAPTIEPSDEDLRTYFDNNGFRYETPAMVRVNYVEFPATRYLTQVQLTDDEVRAFYESNPARFPAPTTEEGETPTIGADLDADFLAVRDQVSAALRYERARSLAQHDAADLTVAIFDAKVSGDALGEFVATQGRTLRAGQPFPRNAPPAFLGGSGQAAAAAFQLDESRALSDALPTAAGAVVLVFQERIEPAPSAFEAVADRVRADYLENQKRERFVALGRQLRSSLESKLAAGTAFADAVADLDAKGATIKTESFADFTLMSRPQDFPFSILSSLQNLDAGDVSQMVITGQEGLITHAAAKVAPVLDESNPRYAEVKAQVASVNSSTTASAALRALIAEELGLDGEDHAGHDH
ncbi:peptidylprolyl isomerase [Actomonas aquatica]|uniref:Peptidyl-prolyl cis-trans isomerase n=1 Tax=Actomonas aquatica TaxID=2866162 RepID=A0ABZ1CBU9_9BACT|nr:peptidylprolyl isomerase [Opitutus sp. WL0086]WRQ89125.1 peptidyl-prolyl cis-trans isomerase [Opitutus sp. WL0086]